MERAGLERRGHAGRGQGPLAPGGAGQEGGRRRPGGRAQRAQQAARRGGARRGRPGRRAVGAAPDRAALPAQHPGGGRAGRPGRGRQRGSPPVVAGAGRRAAAARKGGAPGGPALGDRRVAADPRHGARRAAGRVDVPPLPGPGGTAGAGADRLRHRPSLAGVRGDPPADGGADRDHGLHGPPAQVRRRRLPRRARRPVAYPDGRGAAHLSAPGRDPGGVPAPAALYRSDGLLPARGGLGRARHPRACCGCTSFTRWSCSPTPRPRAPWRRRPTFCSGASRCSRSSSSPTGCSTCAAGTSAARRPVPSTWRPTPRASTAGSR